tara:strand:+ start:2423 stop:2632 length:210 start_codon:yes stop_codon:yes gene_type:complete
MHRDAVVDATANMEIKESGRVDCGSMHPLDGRSYVGHSLRIWYDAFLRGSQLSVGWCQLPLLRASCLVP